VDATQQYFQACFDNTAGWLIVAVGHDPYRDERGKYRHRRWSEHPVRWPQQADQAVAAIASQASTADVYACPYLMRDRRTLGNSVSRVLVHADVDHRIDPAMVAELGGFAVASGTSGHGHVYVPMSYATTRAQHEMLCRALVAHLGGDTKYSDNDLLRPPGTLNYKTAVDGGEPCAVEWIVDYAARCDPRALAVVLGVDIAHAEDCVRTAGAPDYAAEQIDLAAHPTVLDTLAETTGDRSADTMRAARACFDAGLTLAQSRWAVRTRPDLAQRLDEFAARRQPVDDLQTCFTTIADEQPQSFVTATATVNTAYAASTNGVGPSVDDQSSLDSGACSCRNCGTQADSPKTVPALTDIEDGFWQTRESLADVHATALARMASPWAVLACCAARALAQVRPVIVLPPLIGGPGSLNWFAAIAAASGGGKGAAIAAARHLVPDDDLIVRNPGSGEGLVQAYVHPDGGTYESIMFNADEIDTVTALGARTGSTLMSVLRQAFTGETLGFAYADKTKRKHLRAHTYRTTLIVSVQPERAGGLLGAAGGGTPQRFMWFPGADPRITVDTADQPWPTAPLRLPEPDTWLYDRQLCVPPEAAEFIKTERARAMQGDQGALDSHALFAREKFAYALAVLDGRADMTTEDWELSGIASAVSTYVRDRVAEQLQEGLRRAAADAGALHGVSQEAADNEKTVARSDRVHRVLRRVLAKLGEADGPMTNRDLSRAIAYRDRPVLNAALQLAVANGLIKPGENATAWVKL
jgi:hypothetical protein